MSKIHSSAIILVEHMFALERVIILDIKDRGNIKWTSLMLVEHRRKLEELKENESNKKRPELDEQIYEIFNYKIKEAIKQKIRVRITYYQDKDYKTVKSYLKKHDSYQKKLILKNDDPSEIPFQDIIDISLLSKAGF